MKSCLVLLLCFVSLTCATTENGYNISAPVNLTGEATTRSVAVFWEHELEEDLRFLVNLSDGQSEFTTERRIAFGGLESNTTYTATVVVVDDEGNSTSMASSISILTRNGEVEEFQVVEVTNSSMRIEWEALDFAVAYVITVERDLSGEVLVDTETVDTFAIFENLMPSTYYIISITPVFDDGEGSESTIRARTDGPGMVVVMFQWQSMDLIIGGQAEILRPINIPNGPYNIRVNFPCSLRRVEVWNAELNEEASNFSSGVFVVTQSRVWELEKSEIGMNFFFENNPRCNFDGRVSADFGIVFDSEEEENMEEQETVATNLTVLVNEWFTNSMTEVDAAGTCNIWLTPPFNIPQPHMMNVSNPKPLPGTFVVALNPGEDCREGFNIQSIWGYTQKETENIEGVENGTLYFVQDRDEWYTNEGGFLYGYNPFTCRSRSISAELITGAPFIQDIHDAPDVEAAM